MTLSLLTFSFMGEVLTRQMNAEKLCEIAKENKIESLDMMTKEIHLYKARALKKAFEKTGVYCGCVTALLPFYQGVEKVSDRTGRGFQGM